MRLDAHTLEQTNILKYYRVTRKWACKTYGLTEGDLELLIYLRCIGRFTINDFKNGELTISWDKKRWQRLRRDGFIEVWRERNRRDSKYAIYKTSEKTNTIIRKIYRILLGEESIPETSRSTFQKRETYTDKVMADAIREMNSKKR